MPIFVSQIWGESLLFAVRARPIFSGKEKLKEFYKTNQAAMFVANHNSWLDIPFIGGTIGWRNYKLVSKAELGRVPILGKAIKIGGHLLLDRSDRKSQLMTLRQGMELLRVSRIISWHRRSLCNVCIHALLYVITSVSSHSHTQDGVHLCTFPEGTRSKDGHLGPFKNGAFKMAHKVGAPVIPISIVGSGAAMPYYWMFPFRAPRSVPVKVVIHDPISSIDKTEDELAAQVRAAVIAGLPEEQRPLSNE
jgi:1-acyl-sn-glycerol-3-phosphate acyltransferase